MWGRSLLACPQRLHIPTMPLAEQGLDASRALSLPPPPPASRLSLIALGSLLTYGAVLALTGLLTHTCALLFLEGTGGLWGVVANSS